MYKYTDIDSVANAFARNFLNNQMKAAAIQGFKVGAEWMAGQGETLEGKVVKDINNQLAISAEGFSGIEAKFGDKVTVQVRKK